ncbi:hypothetical protein EDD29_4852 [Actinocorallia herbida]|uniref:Uncharacterized protein n=1 Tax=Actinocorallia herbida TaxID=58109 RepID=A0A3N1D150_9ACTN|nr:DUF6668 family protein [Actinocorallia herbida]ROO87257.1 hypothetical protein EDD29_4852 [Actinocorallia herbida]
MPPRHRRNEKQNVAQPAVRESAGLPVAWLDEAPAGIWFVGCHGGAGTTTLSHTAHEARDGGRCWPIPHTGAVKVVLVAHPDVQGLRTAGAAARQYAEDPRLRARVRLLGLALVSWAPGRLPRHLVQVRQSLRRAFPRIWDIEYMPELRLGESLADMRPPKSLQTLQDDLERMEDDHWADSLRWANQEDGDPR